MLESQQQSRQSAPRDRDQTGVTHRLLRIDEEEIKMSHSQAITPTTVVPASAGGHFRGQHVAAQPEGDPANDSAHFKRSRGGSKHKERIEAFKNLKNQLKELRSDMNNKF